MDEKNEKKTLKERIEEGVSYNVCTTMGCEDWLQNSHYLGHEWYTDDGVCLKSEW